jgi:Bacteriophage head to tail connecting protein.
MKGISTSKTPEELWEIQGTSLERGRDWRLSETGISSGVDVFINATDMRLKRNAEFELLHYWENDRHTITVNRQKVIYDGPSPYWRHRKLPFIAATYERLPNQFFGMSAVQIISDLQEEENTIHNQRTDNVNFILNKMWKVRRGADIDESELVSRPFGVIHVDHPDDVSEIPVADVAASSFHQQNIISTIMENTLATPPVIQGAESGSRKTLLKH